jgi:polar amino acid transport system substrate-binding protein
LLASISHGKPILAARRSADGQPASVSIDLACELAEQLGVPLALEVFDAAGKPVQAVTQ